MFVNKGAVALRLQFDLQAGAVAEKRQDHGRGGRPEKAFVGRCCVAPSLDKL
jgi:hypothetical protein